MRRGGIVDIHSHLIPGVDDGASDEAETRHGIHALVADGVDRAITTPHVRLFAPGQGSVAERLSEIDAGWTRLVAAGTGSLEVRRGAELRLDTGDPDLSDDRLRLGGTRYALVEYPYFTIPPRSNRVLALIASRGWIAVVAHPERYSGLDADLEVVSEWREAGARLQVNAGSLLGRYGERAAGHAWSLVERGWADLLGSDYHSRGQPRVAEAVALLQRRGAGVQAEHMTRTNPGRIWEDAPLLPLDPCELVPVPGEDSAAERA